MPDRRIVTPNIEPNREKVRFSFEYLQRHHPKFAITECSREFFLAVFAELERYRTFSMEAFMQASAEDHRHGIYFPDTSEPEGFPGIEPSNDEDLWTDTPWQFSLRGRRGEASSSWRIHGFIADDTFYIVWLDPFHRLN